MEIKELNRGDRRQIDSVVRVHMASFPGFFLTFLGKGFLRQLYRGFAEHDKSGLIIAENETGIAGFLAYSNNVSEFYKHLIKKHLIRFAFYSLRGFIRSPRSLFRLVRALTYPKSTRRNEEYIELSSIGVHPASSGSGIGSRLIDELKAMAKGTDAAYIKLETDADDNEKANSFYQKNRFRLDHVYETPEKRRMNEYRFYLDQERAPIR